MDKLKPFAHLIGTVPDGKLAEMAGLSMEELTVAKAALAAEAAPEPEKPKRAAKSDLAADVAELRAALADERAFRLELEGSHRALAEQHRALAASHDVALRDIATLRAQAGMADLIPPRKEAPVAGVPEVSAPADIPAGRAAKVIRNVRIKGYQGKPTALHFGDILTGEEAAWMLQNHPSLVKAYG